jgi:dipeptidyl aminopeptidase/acylaminoacyl peptidase
MHGDADLLVPLQQSELLTAKLEKAGVESRLIVKKGAGHGWPGIDKDISQFADWFDRHLRKTDKPAASTSAPGGDPTGQATHYRSKR